MNVVYRPGSALIVYAIRNPTAVTDQDRAAAAAQLINAIDPTTNSIVIDGEPNPLSGSPVLLLDGDSKEGILISFKYHQGKIGAIFTCPANLLLASQAIHISTCIECKLIHPISQTTKITVTRSLVLVQGTDKSTL